MPHSELAGMQLHTALNEISRSAMKTLEEQRNFARQPLRQLAIVFCEQQGKLIQIRAWTDDLSPGGAKLLTDEKIPSELIVVRILMPGLSDRLFEATVVHSQSLDEQAFAFNEKMPKHTYGIEFTGICQDEQVLNFAGM